MTLRERFKKSVALGLIVTFVMTQNTPMTWAQVMQSLAGTSDRPFLLQQIPSEFGRIQEAHQGTIGKSVILIQDAHGSLPVQKNIRSLISFLNEQYGIKLLLLEGAAQKLEPDLYRFYEEAEPSRLVGERLLERGELTGAEVFLLDQAIDQTCGWAKPGAKQKLQCAEGQGAEAPEVYARDLTLFREIISRDSELGAQLGTLSLLFQKKAGRILSPELLQFLKAVDQAETAEQALPETLQKINVQAQETLQIDFLNPRHQFEYPMLVRYFKLREMEGKIQAEAAEAESQRLVKWLETNKAPQSLIKQIRELSPKTSRMRAVLEELVRVMQPTGFDFKDYPQWTQWAGMNALMQEVEPTALMKEMEQLIWKIVSKLAPKPEEKAILTLYRKTFYLRKLLTLSLSSDEWQKIDSRRSELTPSRLWSELGETKLDSNLDKAFSKAIQFYEAAKQREVHFIENLKKQMQAKQQSRAVLVAGGFHQSGVLEKLKSEGYGYVSVMPNAGGFDLKESKKTYRRTMLETSQVAQLLRMFSPKSMTPAMAALVNLASRRSEIRAAMTGINGVIRPGTALDQRQSLADSRRSVPVRSEARAPSVIQAEIKKKEVEIAELTKKKGQADQHVETFEDTFGGLGLSDEDHPAFSEKETSRRLQVEIELVEKRIAELEQELKQALAAQKAKGPPKSLEELRAELAEVEAQIAGLGKRLLTNDQRPTTYKLKENKFNPNLLNKSQSILLSDDKKKKQRAYVYVDTKNYTSFFEKVPLPGNNSGFVSDSANFSGLDWPDLVHVAQKTGSTDIYLVVKDGVDFSDNRKFPKKSKQKQYNFFWLHQKDVESAEGYAKYKDVLEYEPVDIRGSEVLTDSSVSSGSAAVGSQAFSPKDFFDQLNWPLDKKDKGLKLLKLGSGSNETLGKVRYEVSEWSVMAIEGLYQVFSIHGGLDAAGKKFLAMHVVDGTQKNLDLSEGDLLDVEINSSSNLITYILDVKAEAKVRAFLNDQLSSGQKSGRINWEIKFKSTEAAAPVTSQKLAKKWERKQGHDVTVSAIDDPSMKYVISIDKDSPTISGLFAPTRIPGVTSEQVKQIAVIANSGNPTGFVYVLVEGAAKATGASVQMLIKGWESKDDRNYIVVQVDDEMLADNPKLYEGFFEYEQVATSSGTVPGVVAFVPVIKSAEIEIVKKIKVWFEYDAAKSEITVNHKMPQAEEAYSSEPLHHFPFGPLIGMEVLTLPGQAEPREDKFLVVIDDVSVGMTPIDSAGTPQSPKKFNVVKKAAKAPKIQSYQVYQKDAYSAEIILTLSDGSKQIIEIERWDQSDPQLFSGQPQGQLVAEMKRPQNAGSSKFQIKRWDGTSQFIDRLSKRPRVKVYSSSEQGRKNVVLFSESKNHKMYLMVIVNGREKELKVNNLIQASYHKGKYYLVVTDAVNVTKTNQKMGGTDFVYLTEEEALNDPQYKGLFETEPVVQAVALSAPTTIKKIKSWDKKLKTLGSFKKQGRTFEVTVKPRNKTMLDFERFKKGKRPSVHSPANHLAYENLNVKSEDIIQIETKDNKIYIVMAAVPKKASSKKVATEVTSYAPDQWKSNQPYTIVVLEGIEVVYLTEEEALNDPQYQGLFETEPVPGASVVSLQSLPDRQAGSVSSLLAALETRRDELLKLIAYYEELMDVEAKIVAMQDQPGGRRKPTGDQRVPTPGKKAEEELVKWDGKPFYIIPNWKLQKTSEGGVEIVADAGWHYPLPDISADEILQIKPDHGGIDFAILTKEDDRERAQGKVTVFAKKGAGASIKIRYFKPSQLIISPAGKIAAPLIFESSNPEWNEYVEFDLKENDQKTLVTAIEARREELLKLIAELEAKIASLEPRTTSHEAENTAKNFEVKQWLGNTRIYDHQTPESAAANLKTRWTTHHFTLSHYLPANPTNVGVTIVIHEVRHIKGKPDQSKVLLNQIITAPIEKIINIGVSPERIVIVASDVAEVKKAFDKKILNYDVDVVSVDEALKNRADLEKMGIEFEAVQTIQPAFKVKPMKSPLVKIGKQEVQFKSGSDDFDVTDGAGHSIKGLKKDFVAAFKLKGDRKITIVVKNGSKDYSKEENVPHAGVYFKFITESQALEQKDKLEGIIEFEPVAAVLSNNSDERALNAWTHLPENWKKSGEPEADAVGAEVRGKNTVAMFTVIKKGKAKFGEWALHVISRPSPTLHTNYFYVWDPESRELTISNNELSGIKIPLSANPFLNVLLDENSRIVRLILDARFEAEIRKALEGNEAPLNISPGPSNFGVKVEFADPAAYVSPGALVSSALSAVQAPVTQQTKLISDDHANEIFNKLPAEWIDVSHSNATDSNKRIELNSSGKSLALDVGGAVDWRLTYSVSGQSSQMQMVYWIADKKGLFHINGKKRSRDQNPLLDITHKGNVVQLVFDNGIPPKDQALLNTLNMPASGKTRGVKVVFADPAVYVSPNRSEARTPASSVQRSALSGQGQSSVVGRQSLFARSEVRASSVIQTEIKNKELEIMVLGEQKSIHDKHAKEFDELFGDLGDEANPAVEEKRAAEILQGEIEQIQTLIDGLETELAEALAAEAAKGYNALAELKIVEEQIAKIESQIIGAQHADVEPEWDKRINAASQINDGVELTVSSGSSMSYSVLDEEARKAIDFAMQARGYNEEVDSHISKGKVKTTAGDVWVYTVTGLNDSGWKFMVLKKNDQVIGLYPSEMKKIARFEEPAPGTKWSIPPGDFRIYEEQLEALFSTKQISKPKKQLKKWDGNNLDLLSSYALSEQVSGYMLSNLGTGNNPGLWSNHGTFYPLKIPGESVYQVLHNGTDAEGDDKFIVLVEDGVKDSFAEEEVVSSTSSFISVQVLWISKKDLVQTDEGDWQVVLPQSAKEKTLQVSPAVIKFESDEVDEETSDQRSAVSGQSQVLQKQLKKWDGLTLQIKDDMELITHDGRLKATIWMNGLQYDIPVEAKNIFQVKHDSYSDEYVFLINENLEDEIFSKLPQEIVAHVGAAAGKIKVRWVKPSQLTKTTGGDFEITSSNQSQFDVSMGVIRTVIFDAAEVPASAPKKLVKWDGTKRLLGEIPGKEHNKIFLQIVNDSANWVGLRVTAPNGKEGSRSTFNTNFDNRFLPQNVLQAHYDEVTATVHVVLSDEVERMKAYLQNQITFSNTQYLGPDVTLNIIYYYQSEVEANPENYPLFEFVAKNPPVNGELVEWDGSLTPMGRTPTMGDFSISVYESVSGDSDSQSIMLNQDGADYLEHKIRRKDFVQGKYLQGQGPEGSIYFVVRNGVDVSSFPKLALNPKVPIFYFSKSQVENDPWFKDVFDFKTSTIFSAASVPESSVVSLQSSVLAAQLDALKARREKLLELIAIEEKLGTGHGPRATGHELKMQPMPAPNALTSAQGWRVRPLEREDSDFQGKIGTAYIPNYQYPRDPEVSGYSLSFDESEDGLVMVGSAAGTYPRVYSVGRWSIAIDPAKFITAGYDKENSRLYIVLDDSLGQIPAGLVQQIPNAEIHYLLESEAIQKRDELSATLAYDKAPTVASPGTGTQVPVPNALPKSQITSPMSPVLKESLENRRLRLIDWLEWTKVASTSAVAGIAAQIVALVEAWLDLDQQIADHGPRATGHELKPAAAPKMRVKPMSLIDERIYIGKSQRLSGGQYDVYLSAKSATQTSFKVHRAKESEPEVVLAIDQVHFNLDSVLQAKTRNNKIYFVMKPGVELESLPETTSWISHAQTETSGVSVIRIVYLTEDQALNDPQYAQLFDLEPVPQKLKRIPSKVKASGAQTSRNDHTHIAQSENGWLLKIEFGPGSNLLAASLDGLLDIHESWEKHPKDSSNLVHYTLLVDDDKAKLKITNQYAMGTPLSGVMLDVLTLAEAEQLFLQNPDEAPFKFEPVTEAVSGMKLIPNNWFQNDYPIQDDMGWSGFPSPVKEVRVRKQHEVGLLSLYIGLFDGNSTNFMITGQDVKKFITWGVDAAAGKVVFVVEDGAPLKDYIISPTISNFTNGVLSVEIIYESEAIARHEEFKTILKYAGAVKLIPHPWLANPIKKQKLGTFSTPNSGIDIRFNNGIVFFDHVINSSPEELAAVDKNDIVSIGWDDTEKQAVVILKEDVSPSKYASHQGISFALESYALANPDAFKDILKYENLEASDQQSAVSGQPSAFDPQVFSDLFVAGDNIGNVKLTGQRGTVESSIVDVSPARDDWRVKVKLATGDVLVTGSKTKPGKATITTSTLNYIDLLLLDIAVDQNLRQFVFTFDKDSEQDVRAALSGKLTVAADGKFYGYRVEFAFSTPGVVSVQTGGGSAAQTKMQIKKVDMTKSVVVGLNKHGLEVDMNYMGANFTLPGKVRVGNSTYQFDKDKILQAKFLKDQGADGEFWIVVKDGNPANWGPRVVSIGVQGTFGQQYDDYPVKYIFEKDALTDAKYQGVFDLEPVMQVKQMPKGDWVAGKMSDGSEVELSKGAGFVFEVKSSTHSIGSFNFKKRDTIQVKIKNDTFYIVVKDGIDFRGWSTVSQPTPKGGNPFHIYHAVLLTQDQALNDPQYAGLFELEAVPAETASHVKLIPNRWFQDAGDPSIQIGVYTNQNGEQVRVTFEKTKDGLEAKELIPNEYQGRRDIGPKSEDFLAGGVDARDPRLFKNVMVVKAGVDIDALKNTRAGKAGAVIYLTEEEAVARYEEFKNILNYELVPAQSLQPVTVIDHRSISSPIHNMWIKSDKTIEVKMGVGGQDGRVAMKLPENIVAVDWTYSRRDDCLYIMLITQEGDKHGIQMLKFKNDQFNPVGAKWISEKPILSYSILGGEKKDIGFGEFHEWGIQYQDGDYGLLSIEHDGLKEERGVTVSGKFVTLKPLFSATVTHFDPKAFYDSLPPSWKLIRGTEPTSNSKKYGFAGVPSPFVIFPDITKSGEWGIKMTRGGSVLELHGDAEALEIFTLEFKPVTGPPRQVVLKLSDLIRVDVDEANKQFEFVFDSEVQDQISSVVKSQNVAATSVGEWGYRLEFMDASIPSSQPLLASPAAFNTKTFLNSLPAPWESENPTTKYFDKKAQGQSSFVTANDPVSGLWGIHTRNGLVVYGDADDKTSLTIETPSSKKRLDYQTLVDVKVDSEMKQFVFIFDESAKESITEMLSGAFEKASAGVKWGYRFEFVKTTHDQRLTTNDKAEQTLVQKREELGKQIDALKAEAAQFNSAEGQALRAAEVKKAHLAEIQAKIAQAQTDIQALQTQVVVKDILGTEQVPESSTIESKSGGFFELQWIDQDHVLLGGLDGKLTLVKVIRNQKQEIVNIEKKDFKTDFVSEKAIVKSIVKLDAEHLVVTTDNHIAILKIIRENNEITELKKTDLKPAWARGSLNEALHVLDPNHVLVGARENGSLYIYKVEKSLMGLGPKKLKLLTDSYIQMGDDASQFGDVEAILPAGPNQLLVMGYNKMAIIRVTPASATTAPKIQKVPDLEVAYPGYVYSESAWINSDTLIVSGLTGGGGSNSYRTEMYHAERNELGEITGLTSMINKRTNDYIGAIYSLPNGFFIAGHKKTSLNKVVTQSDGKVTFESRPGQPSVSFDSSLAVTLKVNDNSVLVATGNPEGRLKLIRILQDSGVTPETELKITQLEADLLAMQAQADQLKKELEGKTSSAGVQLRLKKLISQKGTTIGESNGQPVIATQFFNGDILVGSTQNKVPHSFVTMPGQDVLQLHYDSGLTSLNERVVELDAVLYVALKKGAKKEGRPQGNRVKIVYVNEDEILADYEKWKNVFQFEPVQPMKFKPRNVGEIYKSQSDQYPNVKLEPWSNPAKVSFVDPNIAPGSVVGDTFAKFVLPQGENGGEFLYYQNKSDLGAARPTVKKQVLDIAITGHRVVNGVDQYAVIVIVDENGRLGIHDMDGSGKVYKVETISVADAEKRHEELAQYGFQFESVGALPKFKLTVWDREKIILEQNGNAGLFANWVGNDVIIYSTGQDLATIDSYSFFSTEEDGPALQIKFWKEQSTIVIALKNGAKKSGLRDSIDGRSILYLTEDEILADYEKWKKVGFQFEPVSSRPTAQQIYDLLSSEFVVTPSGQQKQVDQGGNNYAVMDKPAENGNWKIAVKNGFGVGNRLTLRFDGDEYKLEIYSQPPRYFKSSDNLLLGFGYQDGRVVIILDEAIKSQLSSDELFLLTQSLTTDFPEGMNWTIEFASQQNRSEARAGAEQKNRSEKREGALADEETTVARDATWSVFSLDAARRAAVAVRRLLKTINPAWFADEKAGLDSGALLNDDQLMTERVAIGRIYKVLPSMRGPEMEFLADYLASNPLARLVVSAPVKRSDGMAFVNQLLSKAQSRRMKQGNTDKTFDIQWKDSVVELKGQLKGRALLFSDQSAVDIRGLNDVLAVQNDRSEESQVLAGLAAGLKELFSPRKHVGWVKASSLLEYVGLLAEVSKAFAQSA